MTEAGSILSFHSLNYSVKLNKGICKKDQYLKILHNVRWGDLSFLKSYFMNIMKAYNLHLRKFFQFLFFHTSKALYINEDKTFIQSEV